MTECLGCNFEWKLVHETDTTHWPPTGNTTTTTGGDGDPMPGNPGHPTIKKFEWINGEGDVVAKVTIFQNLGEASGSCAEEESLCGEQAPCDIDLRMTVTLASGYKLKNVHSISVMFDCNYAPSYPGIAVPKLDDIIGPVTDQEIILVQGSFDCGHEITKTIHIEDISDMTKNADFDFKLKCKPCCFEIEPE